MHRIPVWLFEICPAVGLWEFLLLLLLLSLGSAKGRYLGSGERSDTYTPVLYMISTHRHQLECILFRVRLLAVTQDRELTRIKGVVLL